MCNQAQVDKSVRDLIDSVAKTFERVKELSKLDLQSPLKSLNDATQTLLDLLIRICLFL